MSDLDSSFWGMDYLKNKNIEKLIKMKKDIKKQIRDINNTNYLCNYNLLKDEDYISNIKNINIVRNSIKTIRKENTLFRKEERKKSFYIDIN